MYFTRETNEACRARARGFQWDKARTSVKRFGANNDLIGPASKSPMYAIIRKNVEFPTRYNLIQFIQLGANIGAVLPTATLIAVLDRRSRPIIGTKREESNG